MTGAYDEDKSAKGVLRNTCKILSTLEKIGSELDNSSAITLFGGSSAEHKI